jgi:hemerythrin-like metal-binding protein
VDEFKIASILIYILALPLWVLLWWKLIGFGWFKKIPYLQVTFYGALAVLAINLFLAYLAEIPEYDTETGLYTYVETNAITVAGLALVIATLSIVTLSRGSSIDQDRRMNLFIKCIFTAFLLGILGVLPLYWVPQVYGWLTLLRHIKTVPEIFSVFLLGSAMLVYLSMVKVHELKDISIEIKKRQRAEQYRKGKMDWDSSLSVGINEIDEQHMMIMYRVKELCQAIDRDEDTSILYDTLNFLINYAEHHFATEEKLMLEVEYPGYEAHKAKHEEFKISVKGMGQDLIEKGATDELADRIDVFLINWVLDHIKGVDQEMGAFLSTHGKD